MHNMHESEIATRAAAIRLPLVELAGLAGLNKHTTYYVAYGKRDCLSSTRDRLLRALEEEERRLLDYLLGRRDGAQQ
ncbi:hypothetical protein V5F49_11135 [Xanthobacter sp. V3C-3]|uniref:hypothetical protein n=1 Tax=Xanthobacter lutulentifluminis TaxID=3119935 RepID=UPI00372A18DC